LIKEVAMKNPRLIAGILFALGFAFLATGCSSYSSRSARTKALNTYAIIAVGEQGLLSQAELGKVQNDIVQYLVARGYVQSGQVLVDDPVYADVVFRVRLASSATSPGPVITYVAPSYSSDATATAYAAGASDSYTYMPPGFDSQYGMSRLDRYGYNNGLGYYDNFYDYYNYGPYSPFIGGTIFIQPVYPLHHPRHPSPIAHQPGTTHPPFRGHRPPADSPSHRPHRDSTLAQIGRFFYNGSGVAHSARTGYSSSPTSTSSSASSSSSSSSSSFSSSSSSSPSYSSPSYSSGSPQSGRTLER
jgi:hypothetical protein